MVFSAFARKFDNWINPIAIKEMRQAVKSRFIAWSLIIFLLIQLAIIGAFLMLSEDLGQDFNTGRNVFMGLLAALLGTCLFLLPAFTALRFSMERSEQNIDLFFITTLRPIQIIWGKTLAALVLLLLFFSASMPFMTLTYLLRGLDIPSAFILLGLDFLVVAGCIQLGILMASLPGKAIAQAARFLGGLFILFIVFSFTMQASFGILYFGVGSSVGTWKFWGPALTTTIYSVMGIGLMFVLSVTIITPRSANKALGVRIYLLFVWLVSTVVAGIWSFVMGNDLAIKTWMITMVLLFCVTMYIAICERQEWGPRIRRTIPVRKVFRIPAFFLYSGAAGGIALSITMIVATVLLAVLGEKAFSFGVSFSSDFDGRFMSTIVFALYTCCYSLTALFIRNTFLARSSRTNVTAVIALLLLVTGSILPMVFGFLLRANPWNKLSSRWFLGNPFIVFWERDIWHKCLLFTSIWTVSVIALNLPWFIRQIRSFKPFMQTLADVSEASNE